MADYSSYDWLTAGSTATSAATPHDLFGSYQGLSLLKGNEQGVIIQTWATAADLRVGPAGSVTNNIGLKLSVALSMIDLPMMRVDMASRLQFVREGGTDATAHWIIWSRRLY